MSPAIFTKNSALSACFCLIMFGCANFPDSEQAGDFSKSATIHAKSWRSVKQLQNELEVDLAESKGKLRYMKDGKISRPSYDSEVRIEENLWSDRIG